MENESFIGCLIVGMGFNFEPSKLNFLHLGNCFGAHFSNNNDIKLRIDRINNHGIVDKKILAYPETKDISKGNEKKV